MINLLLSTAHEPSYPSVTMSPTILYIFSISSSKYMNLAEEVVAVVEE